MKHWKRNISFFITGQMISFVGSLLVQYAIFWYINLETKSGTILTIAIIASFIPLLIFSPIAGVLADKMNRKLLIVIADGSIALVTLITAILFSLGDIQIWMLIVVTGIRGIGQAIHGPAIGAAIPLILKTLPNILLLIAAILLVLNARDLIQSLNVEEDQLQDIMPILVATLSLAMALGGFAFKQYSHYKNKKILFQKDVTDTLFFKNLANNDSVFQRFIDIAEEEECKEIILVYYHLLTSQNPLNPEQLDAKIESWMQENLGIRINFDIHGPLNNLQEIRGKIENNPNQPEVPLLSYDQQGYCHVIPLKQARTVIDWVWDNAFQYNGKAL
jgi:hypothetical protein